MKRPQPLSDPLVELRAATEARAAATGRQHRLIRELHAAGHSFPQLSRAAQMSTASAFRIAAAPTHAVVTVGYEGRTLDEVIDLLREARVSLLVDVRQQALSRKRGFSKTALSLAIRHAGMTYEHDARLGNPKENRAAYRAGRAEEGAAVFQRHMNEGSRPAFDWLARRATEHRVGLLCFEADPSCCHRSTIARQLQDEDPSLSVVHAGA